MEELERGGKLARQASFYQRIFSSEDDSVFVLLFREQRRNDLSLDAALDRTLSHLQSWIDEKSASLRRLASSLGKRGKEAAQDTLDDVATIRSEVEVRRPDLQTWDWKGKIAEMIQVSERLASQFVGFTTLGKPVVSPQEDFRFGLVYSPHTITVSIPRCLQLADFFALRIVGVEEFIHSASMMSRLNRGDLLDLEGYLPSEEEEGIAMRLALETVDQADLSESVQTCGTAFYENQFKWVARPHEDPGTTFGDYLRWDGFRATDWLLRMGGLKVVKLMLAGDTRESAELIQFISRRLYNLRGHEGALHEAV